MACDTGLIATESPFLCQTLVACLGGTLKTATAILCYGAWMVEDR